MANSKSSVIDDVSEFIEVKTELIKIKILSRLAKATSGIVSLSLILVVGIFFVLFSSFAIANLINQAVDSSYLGFVVIAGCYLLLIVIIFVMIKKKTIQRLFEKLIFKIVESEDDESID